MGFAGDGVSYDTIGATSACAALAAKHWRQMVYRYGGK